MRNLSMNMDFLKFRRFKSGLEFSVYAFYLINIISGWRILEISGIKGDAIYEDLKSILVSGDCYKIIGDLIYNPDINHLNCQYYYGRPLAAVISVLNIPSYLYYWIGSSLTIAVLVALIRLSPSRKNDNHWKVRFILLLSPSLWLLFERANFDAVMFLAVYGAIVLHLKNRIYIAPFIIFITALFKFYTFPLLLIFFFLNRSAKYRIYVFGLTIISLTSILTDSQLSKGVPETWFISFGVPYPGLFLNLFFKHFSSNNYFIGKSTALIIGILTFSLFLLIEFLIRQRNSISKISNQLREFKFDLMIWFFGIVHLTCFGLGMNYDYRLVFEIALVLRFITLSPNAGTNNCQKVIAVVAITFNCFALGAPLSSSLGVAIQLLGAVAQTLLTSWIFWLTVIQTVKFFKRPNSLLD
jgi:hypothetical protein